MAATFRLEIASPERQLLDDQVAEAVIPGATGGAIGILPGHAPLLGELGIGELSYTMPDGRRQSIAVQGGFLEVSAGHVRVLAHHAEHASEIDVSRAEQALRRATERITNPLPGVDIARALNAMRRAQARLDAARNGSGGAHVH